VDQIADVVAKKSAGDQVVKEVVEQLKEMEKENVELKKTNIELTAWKEAGRSELDVLVSNLTQGWTLCWGLARWHEFAREVAILACVGVWIVVVAVFIMVANSRWIHSVSDLLPNGRLLLHIAEAVTHLLIIGSSCGFLLWLKYMDHTRLEYCQEFLCSAYYWYVHRSSEWARRYIITFENERHLVDSELQDLRADSISLLELKHKLPRLAHFRIIDRLTGRETVRLAAVEVMVQIVTGQNTCMLDDEKIVKARLHASANKLMSVNLSRYLVLQQQLVIPNTADIAFALYSKAREDRSLITPFF
jgi:hypothetical protein